MIMLNCVDFIRVVGFQSLQSFIVLRFQIFYIFISLPQCIGELISLLCNLITGVNNLAESLLEVALSALQVCVVVLQFIL